MCPQARCLARRVKASKWRCPPWTGVAWEWLRALWAFSTDPAGTAFIMEISALANHRKEIRAEWAAYAEQFRQPPVLEWFVARLEPRHLGAGWRNGDDDRQIVPGRGHQSVSAVQASRRPGTS